MLLHRAGNTEEIPKYTDTKKPNFWGMIPTFELPGTWKFIWMAYVSWYKDEPEKYPIYKKQWLKLGQKLPPLIFSEEANK